MTDDADRTDLLRDISALFGSYRAEWLDNDVFDLFTEPDYLSQLENHRPSVLVGGRGTGKTTVLRGMSYEGQYLLRHGTASDPLHNLPYIGLYYRVNSTRVSAFRGPELSEEAWIRYFAHYVNLLFCSQVVDFVMWYARLAGSVIDAPTGTIERVCTALHLESVSDFVLLSRSLSQARTVFEAAINNVGDEPHPPLSALAAPIDALVDVVLELPQFSGKRIYFLIDEYENFSQWQQRVVNTVIKHATSRYVFKIGVRELGWRERGTLTSHERLTHPADYALIEIKEELVGESFRSFAERVCDGRLARLRSRHAFLPESIASALPGISEEEEAALLGVREIASALLYELADTAPELAAFAQTLAPTELLLVRYWSAAGRGSIPELIRERQLDPVAWRIRHGNYIHSALYTIRRGKRGFRKYYSGWDTFTHLAERNIRYLLELVHQSLLSHVSAGEDPARPVSPDNQTAAATSVGRRNLDELEGLSVEGARLTRLLLSLGRVFGVLASTPEGHTPEVNQFELAGSTEQPDFERASDLINLAVMHQALVRYRGTKPADSSDTRDFDYMIHPVFAPFFVFSYRRKRKISLTPTDLLALIDDPRDAIRRVLNGQNRVVEIDLPDQLQLFEGYYSAVR